MVSPDCLYIGPHILAKIELILLVILHVRAAPARLALLHWTFAAVILVTRLRETLMFPVIITLL